MVSSTESEMKVKSFRVLHPALGRVPVCAASPTMAVMVILGIATHSSSASMFLVCHIDAVMRTIAAWPQADWLARRTWKRVPFRSQRPRVLARLSKFNSPRFVISVVTTTATPTVPVFKVDSPGRCIDRAHKARIANSIEASIRARSRSAEKAGGVPTGKCGRCR